MLAIICDGKYTAGNILDIATMKNVRISNHSGSGILLVGEIPYWNEIKEAAHIIAEVVLYITYMGIDFCVTNDNGVKINSLSSLDCIQMDKSIFKTDGGELFRERLKINNRYR